MTLYLPLVHYLVDVFELHLKDVPYKRSNRKSVFFEELVIKSLY